MKFGARLITVGPCANRKLLDRVIASVPMDIYDRSPLSVTYSPTKRQAKYGIKVLKMRFNSADDALIVSAAIARTLRIRMPPVIAAKAALASMRRKP